MSVDVSERDKVEELFGSKKYGVENVINLYAISFVVIPAAAIYDKAAISSFRQQIESCHIYLIGLTPKIDLVDVSQLGSDLVTSLEMLGKRYDIKWPLPSDTRLAGDPDTTGWYVVDTAGRRSFPSTEMMTKRLSHEEPSTFEVLYIGQAFGDEGSRNALDRLTKHETLQKIAVQGIPSGYNLTLLLLDIEPDNRMITMFNPWAQDTINDQKRISSGLDKLFESNEAEKTTIYEASMIRYFEPKFNKEFKNSFPSTNMKLLADCYAKDINAVTAEICFDEIPFMLFSEKIPPKWYHIAHHDLHKEEDRSVFFFER